MEPLKWARSCNERCKIVQSAPPFVSGVQPGHIGAAIRNWINEIGPSELFTSSQFNALGTRATLMSRSVTNPSTKASTLSTPTHRGQLVIGKHERGSFAKYGYLSYGENRERFCNTSAIQRGAYLLAFSGDSAECFIHIAPGYIRAIAFLCEPLTRREPHRSIAFTGRNSCS